MSQGSSPDMEREAGALNGQGRTLKAYRLPGFSFYPKVIPANADRWWMDFSTNGWANRCLPLRIANQNGWFILNGSDFEVAWTGSNKLESIKFVTKTASE